MDPEYFPEEYHLEPGFGIYYVGPVGAVGR